jgi:hypothetical protein
VNGKATGFRVHGKQGKDEDSRFAVVATEADKQLLLFVEIWDDRWVGPEPGNSRERWLFDDHLELWLSGPVSYSSHCTEKRDGAPEQWAIRITDGQVFPAMGATQGRPAVERVLGADGVARLRIALPAGKVHENIALVYSDSDDGKRQKRLIATSQVKLGWAASLGVLQFISPDAASCVVSRGQLEPVLATPRRDPDKPLWGM